MLLMMNLMLDFSHLFIFNQKTAYEMRISDWSSDVCSSDLLWFAIGAAIGGIMWLINSFNEPRVKVRTDAHVRQIISLLNVNSTREFHQIGRSSCRESGCQYV